MQYYINDIKKELEDLANLKRERALIGMSAEFQQVFLLLPALFHYHTPELPGYMEGDIPSGIACYQLSDDTNKLLKSKFNFVVNSNETSTNTPLAISALYSMGSTCSIGQSVQSDLDIWICIENSLTDNQKEALQKKCRLIENWAADLQVKLTLFVVDADRFINKHHECLMGENCGSAQHILLLEEFYRSANLLAGKFLLWFVVPYNFTVNNVTYPTYEKCVKAMVDLNLIERDQWIDFGPLTGLSAEEYFGASLWQLYKSIDSPFKAVLKTLLLEAYSWIYPQNKPVAYQMRELIQNGEIHTGMYLDSYYMLLDRISKYLIEINDFQRLELIRNCFYLKVNEKLSIPMQSYSWRRAILSDLVKDWGWNEQQIAKLDACQTWKIGQVREIHEILLNTMMIGYRNLLNFGRRNNLDSLISPQDLAILTRKLYAAFEVLPGKITTLKLNISGNLQEDALTFIHVAEDRINRSGWYVYNQKPMLQSIIGHQYLEYSKYLVKLVGWCYFNGLIADTTTFYYHDGENRNNSKINQLIADLKNYFPIDVPAATEEQLYGPCEIRHLAIILNLEDDPTANIELDDEVTNSVLNYGKHELSLVGSIDLLYRNSWNEIRILHFSGSLSMLEAIKALLNRMHKDADLPNSIEIFCYSEYLGTEIRQQMKKLMDECIDLRLTTTKNNLTQVKPLRIGGSSWYLFFERLGVSCHQFENAIDFYGAVSNNKVQGRPLNILDETSELPKEIDSIAYEGIIQFFFEDTHLGFDLYILNEHNQIEIYRNCNGSKDNMVKDINDFYVLSDDRFTFTTSSVNFNLPQFYQIAYNDCGERKITPLN
ncbi:MULTISPECIES: class I adenylate cyclase [unclassified Gilliamella]|uniref:class I adenylate cyclase n=1 Tax=unclassified Gilliamella TaxID=2685620 RepID=UPI00080ECA0B|nr:class I adenylate cyclase [Gilliamella apicola]OCG20547.1 adenylate cyclase [Gilliamella apicola]OCG23160.1 adenylate cyclase [Gilliamella apicola]